MCLGLIWDVEYWTDVSADTEALTTDLYLTADDTNSYVTYKCLFALSSPFSCLL